MLRLLLLFLLGSVILLLMYTRIPIKQFNDSQAQFVYLTQTKNCIPTYLKSPEVIGDSEACQCDVIILSYKHKCADTSLPHVQYIFNSSKSTTWTVGRNLLYKAAMKREKSTYTTFSWTTMFN